MSIRLNKAIRELNIGLQTAVEFLEKKKELGEVKGDPNFKLSEAQYGALVSAFKRDKDVKDRAASFLQQKQREKEEKKPTRKTEKRTEPVTGIRQKYNPLGKIELDKAGNPVVKPAAAPEKKDAPQPKTEPAAVSPEPEKPKAVVKEGPKAVQETPATVA